MKKNKDKVDLLIEDWYRKINKKIDIEDVTDVRTTMIYSDIPRTLRLLKNSTLNIISKKRKLKGHDYF